jgi:hypothetical protein
VLDGVAVPEGVEVVCLVERYGSRRAREEVVSCIEAAVAAWLTAA